MITKQDFDKATEKPWTPTTCLIAQKVMREHKQKLAPDSNTYLSMLLSDGSKIKLSEQENRLQAFFDGNHGRDLPRALEEAESNLFFLRAFLPLEDKDI